MQPVRQAPRDPAPSRAAYKMHRMWLTPAYRRLLRIGLPMLTVLAAAAWYFSEPTHVEALRLKVAEIRRSIEERPEFMVKLMAIDGASDPLAEEIRAVVPVDFPISSFDLDLEAMRDRIEDLDAVARADLRIRPGGVLQVQISERVPAVIWRNETGLVALDRDGHPVAPVPVREDRMDLPLIAGQGADRAVTEALEVLATAEPVASRIRGLLRVGERRWTLVLDRNQAIHLPEAQPIEALQQVMALQQAQDLLSRAVMIVDMRNGNRPTLRLAPAAVEEMRQIKLLTSGATPG